MDSILNATADNPVPENHFAGFLEGNGGVKIRYAVFRSNEREAKGTVVLLQGRSECIEKYFETISDLTARGLWVATFDWRGQAGSDRLIPGSRTGHILRFSDYEADLSLFLEKIVLPDARLPFFIVAHSTGALVALSQAPLLENRIERMVLAAPFIALAGQSMSQRKITVIARMASLLGLGKHTFRKGDPPLDFAHNIVTSDPRRFARNAAIFAEHPELSISWPSARWLNETLKTMARVTHQDHLTRIRIPTLLLCPTRDALVPRKAIGDLARIFRAARLIEIDGARHELFQEADRYRMQALAAIDAFIPGSDAEETSLGA
ncbi:alpha/beta hydrolase [Shinella yambaruensis]|uniref:Lysophospholipase n=1 Tax=Shinella yambaruensis TaxID=415996 RepID=A0ABQ5ZJ80_9HYPH|nr:alpha/beta hydrolase [Shinella yambaruensis]MCJ8026883.1 alpha/beta hydrolase [Shinella yambaruensis]MCU7982224.1 alpha/beta hydrolase [Shinella yambaruensis]GLR51401.1 lysophospholipase [Shinella yambaruensis]